jgi:serine/threonine-protein kinase
MSHAQVGERTWIDEVADRFERHWKQGGERPRIEDYLADEAAPRRTRLLAELLRVERELRLKGGETPTPEEYCQRFPDDGAAIDAAFDIAERPGPAPSPPAPSPPPVSAAHSLLFGLLALQNHFIDRDTLLAAFNAWVADKSQSLGQILLDRGALTPARHALLTELVHEHLDQHGHDPERSLAVLTVSPAVRDQLEQVPDVDLQAGLLYLRLATTDDAGDQGEATATWDEESGATDPEGRFQIVRLHDRGALGEVYVARDQQLHRIVALKRIKLDHAVDQEKRARFVVEAEITGRLEHPGIVPVYGLGAYDDGRPFYAMRFIRGDNLKSAIEQFHQEEEKGRGPGSRTLALQKLLRRFLDVCNAIDYAHSRGVLHRDLKPGNIMLGKFGETLVVDWGLAKSLGRTEAVAASATLDERTLIPQSGSDLRGTELGARLGTPAYMSPEQATGRIDELGPASDVYSLGATLYCVLTGRAPFADSAIAELLRKVERGDFVPPRNLKGWIDPALEAICLKAMATDPARRYCTPRALADDVEHWLADEPVSAWREPIRRRLRRWGRRHRLLVTGLAATLIVAMGALAVGNVLVAHQRDRAERNLAFARRVVDEMYTGVAARLDDQVQMDDYQREILEKALEFYDRFALPQSRDPQMRFETARAGLRVGATRSRLGQTAAAERADRLALEILSGLVSEHSAEPAHRDALAQAHQQIGDTLRDQQRWDESEREYKAAAAVWDALAREQPNIAPYRSKLADVQGGLAQLYEHQGRRDEAEAEYRLALSVADRLAQETPDQTAYQESLAKILSEYGHLRKSKGDDAGSEAVLQRAVAILDKLARDRPESTKYQLGLSLCLKSLGQTLYWKGKFPPAEEVLKRAIRILEKLAADHPQNMTIAAELGYNYGYMSEALGSRGDRQSALDWAGREISLYRSLARRDPNNLHISQRGLSSALAGRAETFMYLRRHAEAAADFEEILGVLTKDNRSSELFRAFHALSRARLGDLSALALVDREIRDKFVAGRAASHVYPFFWMNCYDAACLFSAMAKLSLQDQGKTLAERQRLSQRDLERALDLLDTIRAPGEWPKESIPVVLDDIRREPLLDPLRSHPRFQLLMMDLAFPDDPFRP